MINKISKFWVPRTSRGTSKFQRDANMRKKIILSSIILILALITFTKLFAKSDPDPTTPPPTLVEIATAQKTQWQQRVETAGSLKAEQGVMVKPEIAGRITKILFKSGQLAKKNDPLVQLNPDIIKAELAADKAELALQKANYERVLALNKLQATSKAEMDKASAQYQNAQANFERAQARLNQTLITAPFDGRLGLRLANVGDYVSVGDNLVNLQDTDPMLVDFDIPEVYLGKIAVGQTVLIRVDAYPNKTFTGTVTAFNSAVDMSTRTLEMRAETPNKDGLLIPGSFADVTLFVGPTRPVIEIPKTALIYSSQGPFVYKVVQNKAVKTPVSLGEVYDKTVIVEKGLAAGDKVITAGQLKIQDGMPVTTQAANTKTNK